MLLTIDGWLKIHELISKYLVRSEEKSPELKYFFNGGNIPEDDAESLLNWDDSSFGCYGYHPIINFEELRKRVPDWKNLEEYLTEQLLKNAKHAKGYGKRKRMKEIEEMLSNGKLI